MNKNAKNNSTVTPETSRDFEAKRIEDLAPTVAANLNKLLETQNISAKELSEKISSEYKKRMQRRDALTQKTTEAVTNAVSENKAVKPQIEVVAGQ